MAVCNDERIVTIAQLNDEFRRQLDSKSVAFHRSVREWSRVCEVMDGLRVVPGGADEPLRDTGSLEVAGQRIVWRIHYYEPKGRFRRRPLDEGCIRMLVAVFEDDFEGLTNEFWQAWDRYLTEQGQ